MSSPLRPLSRLLVTGGAGFIGSAFIRYLLNLDEFKGHIFNIDKLGHGANLFNLESCVSHARYQFYQADICNEHAIEQICEDHAIDTIVHFAAESHVDRSIHGPQAFIESNLIGTFRLLEVVRKRPHIHFHHISTDEVYGSLGDEGFFNEESLYQPNSPYSATKAGSDHLVRAWHHTYGLSTTTSHCSNNYGPYQHPEKLLPHMIYCCLRNLDLPLYGSGKHVRDWIHVEDHVRAIWLILQRAAKGSVYNIGARCPLDNRALVEKLCLEMASQLDLPQDCFIKRIASVQDRKGHDFRYAIDPRRLEQELGFQPQYDLDSGLRDTVAWYLSHTDWLLAHPPVGVQTQSAAPAN